MKDSRIHIKIPYLKKKKNPNVSECQLEIGYIQPNYSPTQKLSPPLFKCDYALSFVRNHRKTK